MLNPELLALHELEGVLRIGQLFLRLIKLVLQHLQAIALAFMKIQEISTRTKGYLLLGSLVGRRT